MKMTRNMSIRLCSIDLIIIIIIIIIKQLCFLVHKTIITVPDCWPPLLLIQAIGCTLFQFLTAAFAWMMRPFVLLLGSASA